MRAGVAVFVSAFCLFANDGYVTKGAGGLVPAKSGGIAMESEELAISIHRISVSYVFRNSSGRDIDATVAFTLPVLDGGELDNEPVRLPSTDGEFCGLPRLCRWEADSGSDGNARLLLISSSRSGRKFVFVTSYREADVRVRSGMQVSSRSGLSVSTIR
jgi:hypothetical protein